MDVNFTARRFKAHSEIKEYAMEEVKKLQKLYDGIVRTDIILYYERGVNSLKTAEINLHVYGTTLSAHEGTDDYVKSIDGALEKLGSQLRKYKSKLHGKDKTKVRQIREKV
ncbi:MAG: ribosome-associated translation inhibitor RaiA [Bacteroidota bacterium]|jgi:ribosomal subunit interface protein